MRFFRYLAGLVLLAGVAGCGVTAVTPTTATPEEAARAAYVAPGPKSLTLYTMINNRTGRGAHTALMINASQRVIFDPAGSVSLEQMPEVGDVLYGITPTIRDWFERSHARSTFHVRIQSIQVAPEVAEKALQLAMSNGHVGSAQCASVTASILQQLPGFESLPVTLFPGKLSDSFKALPGASYRELHENDDDDKSKESLVDSDT